MSEFCPLACSFNAGLKFFASCPCFDEVKEKYLLNHQISHQIAARHIIFCASYNTVNTVLPNFALFKQ